MRIKHISVCNYRGLKKVEVDIDDFVCVIGENNAGKSSLLKAVEIFIKGASLKGKDNEFYDPADDVVINVKFECISEDDLNRLDEDHIDEIRKICDNDKLELVRRFPIDSTSNLLYMAKTPDDPRFRPNYVRDSLRGANKDTKKWLTENYTELKQDQIDQATSQTKAQEVVDEYVANNSLTIKYGYSETPLPFVEKNIKPLLPELIYVEAVKDFSDEMRARQNDTFGQLLRLLLDSDPLMDEIQQSLTKLRELLDIEDDAVKDDRLQALRKIERYVEGNLQKTFRNASIRIRIPPPELSVFFNNATIEVDDGVIGNIESKGDGMRRSVIFALIRSYVELSKQTMEEGEVEKDEMDTKEPWYLFLFEEPELYLHPKAQRTLFDALHQISLQQHQVIVSTHSPFFFEPKHLGIFIKIIKQIPDNVSQKPYGKALSINLNHQISGMSTRNQFQLISFETSNTAFFADKVVLIEGPSDKLVYHHIARLLNPAWDFKRSSISLVNIGGKGNIKKYREFFQRFDIQVCVITDLDILLHDFDKLAASQQCRDLQSEIIQKVDVEGDIKDDGGSDKIKKENKKKRLEILQDLSKAEILAIKRRLFADLRKSDVFVLEKGAIEAYFPDDIGISGSKPEQALDYREKVNTREDAIKHCELIPTEDGDLPELEVIFGSIFSIAQKTN